MGKYSEIMIQGKLVEIKELELYTINSTMIVFHVFLKSWLILTNLAAFATLVICYHMNIFYMAAQTAFVFEVFSTVRADDIFQVSMNPSNVAL